MNNYKPRKKRRIRFTGVFKTKMVGLLLLSLGIVSVKLFEDLSVLLFCIVPAIAMIFSKENMLS